MLSLLTRIQKCSFYSNLFILLSPSQIALSPFKGLADKNAKPSVCQCRSRRGHSKEEISVTWGWTLFSGTASELASNRTGRRRLCGYRLLPQVGRARAPAPPWRCCQCCPARAPRAPRPAHLRPGACAHPAHLRRLAGRARSCHCPFCPSQPPPTSSLFNLGLLSCANCCSSGCSCLNGLPARLEKFRGATYCMLLE